jgi:hypothetical protein
MKAMTAKEYLKQKCQKGLLTPQSICYLMEDYALIKSRDAFDAARETEIIGTAEDIDLVNRYPIFEDFLKDKRLKSVDKLTPEPGDEVHRRIDDLISHIETINKRLNQLEQFNKVQIVTNDVNVKYLKNYDYRLQELEKKPSGMTGIEGSIMNAQIERINKLETQIAVIHIGHSEWQKKVVEDLKNLFKELK